MKQILSKKNILAAAAALAVYSLLFFLMDAGLLSRHYKSLLVPIGINIILAVSLNLTTGFLGELTLGHAGFMSVGAYAGCIFALAVELPAPVEILLSLLVGGAVASVFGILIGLPVLRLRGDYLAIVTLAFGEIIRSIIVNLPALTGGAAGLKGIPRHTSFTQVYVIAVLVIVIVKNLVTSKQGLIIRTIRENAIAAESIGVNTSYYKVLAFVAAAFFAGVAGVLYGQNLGYLSPSTFDYNKSIEILVIVVLGGMGSLRGSVIAAVLVTALPEMLRGAEDYRMLIYAVVLIAMMIMNASPRVAAFKAAVGSRLSFARAGAAREGGK